MPSLQYPDSGSRYVELLNGRPAANKVGYLYANEALTQVAEAYTDVAGAKGALLPTDDQGRRYVTLDAYGRQPNYWGPESGQKRLWLVVNGVASAVDADYNVRLGTVAPRLTAVENTGGGASAAALDAHVAGTTAVHGIADTSKLVVTTDTRLTNARIPLAHATSHALAGSDPLTLAQAQVAGLTSTLDAKADLVGGLIPTSQIPPSSATFRGEVASEAAMLALPAVKGDYARRTDTEPDTFWTLIADDPTVIGSWLQTSSAGAVSSVNSQSGAVVLGPADVGAVPVARTVATTAPLTGGGDLSGNRTLSVSDATISAKGVVQLAGDLAGSAVAPLIANGAVSAAKILDGNVTSAKLASNSVTSAKIADGSVTAAKLADGVVVPQIVAAGAGIDPLNVTDSTAALQALLTAASANSMTTNGQKLVLPPGRFKVSATLLSDLAKGLEIEGAGRNNTYLIATAALAGQPVFRMQDYYNCTIRNLTIMGTSGSEPSAAIDSHRERNNGVQPGMICQKLHVDNVEMVTVQRGILWSLSGSGADGNNDQTTVNDCYVHGFTVAAYDINGVNSVWHRFVSGEIASGPIAWRMTGGGSFNAFGTVLGALTDVELDVLDGNYIHPTTITGVSHEDGGSGCKIIRTTTTPHFNIMYQGCERTQSAVNKTMIDFNASSYSSLSMSQCYFDLGQLGQVAQFTDSTSTARFTNCPSLAFNTIAYNGKLYLKDNRHNLGTVTLTNLGSGQLFQDGDAGGGFTTATLVPPSRTISTTAPLTGGGDLSTNRTLAVNPATTGAKGVIQLVGDLTGTATAPLVANGAISAAKILDGNVTTAKLADNSVTSAKILDGTIVDADINASAAIAQSKISGLTTALDAKRNEPANYIDPADYGLIPSVSADRTAAFQSVLDAIPAAGGSEIGGACIELPKGVFLLNTPTSGVLLRLTNKPNVTIRGAGGGTILRVSSAVATEILRLETCTNFKLENVLLQVIGTAQVGKAIHYTTETAVGSAHLGRFTNVTVSCNGTYRRAWDFMTVSGSPTVYSAMAAFAAGDVGGNVMINLTGGAWQAGITAVSTLSATLAADITTTTATTVTLNSALPGAPASGFTIQVDTERMYVTAGGNTTTLTVTRGRGADGVKTTHTAGAAVVTYSATLDSSAPSSSSTATAPGRIVPSGTARLDVGLAIGTDHAGSPDLDVANTGLLGFSASRCHVAGIQVGNGTTGDVLDHWMHESSISECGYGLYLTAGSMTVNDCDFSTNLIDVRRFQPVSQECKVDGARTEGPAMFYEMTGAATSGPMTRMSSVQIQTFNAEDGVPIRHLNSAALTLENVDITSSRVFAGTVLIAVAGTSSFPCHLVAINVSSSGGNTDLFSGVTLPTAYKTIISQPRTNTSGNVLANSTQGIETTLRARFAGGLVRGRTTVADANYTVLNSDMVVAYTSLTAARAVTLPAQGATLLAGQEFTIKDESGACDATKTITVSPPSGTIDGAASLAIASAYGKVSVYTNGSNWFTR